MKVKALKAACLAVGLATAWGSPSNAGPSQSTDQIQLTIDPSNNLSHVFFFYATNSTGGNANTLTSLPNLTAGLSTTETFSATPAGFPGNPARFYGVIGLYDETNKLLAISLNNTAAADAIGKDFETEFAGGNPHFTESDLANALLSNDTFTISEFFWIFESEGSDIPLGSSGQLIDFSTGSVGGSLTAVPEPSPILLVSFGTLGILILQRKRSKEATVEN
jgi:hypothetical protein